MKLIIAVAALLLSVATASSLVLSCVSRKAEVLKEKTFVPADERIANGERVYMQYCQKCHPGGEAGLGPAINSNPAPQLIKRFQMRHGLGVMPAFKRNEISKADLKDVSKYLRAWKRY